MTDSPNSLEYFPERRGTESSAVAMYILIAPLMVAILISFFSPTLAWPGAGLTAIWMLLRRRRQRTTPHAVLRVLNSRLTVADATSKVVLDIPLEDLLNVSLDTKTIQKVQENMRSGVPDLRFIDSTVSPGIDVSRIELETLDHGSHFLTEKHISNTDAVEWFGRIRKFLRTNGWVPEDEKTAAPIPTP